MRPIVLASASATRARVLRAAGVAFQIDVSGVDEAPLKAAWRAGGATPAAVAGGLARAKAQAVAARRDGLVIGADQTLELDGAQIDKSESLAAVREVLRALRGRRFQLHAGVALAEGGEVSWTETHSVSLEARPFSDEFLDAYLARNADRLAVSLGGFEYEGEGAQLFDRVEGDYFAVLGLPLLPLLARLRLAGALTT